MVKQVRDYRAKGWKEFSLLGEIRRAKSLGCELSRFLSQFSAKFLNIGRKGISGLLLFEKFTASCDGC